MDRKAGEVTGFFYNQQELERSIVELLAVGFVVSDISTHVENSELEQSLNILGKNKKNSSVETGFAGAGIGAVLGSMLGFLFESGSIESPYFSVVVGAAVGAVFGGVGGAWVGHKIPVQKQSQNESFSEPSEIQITVSTASEAQEQLAKFILAEFGATQITFKMKPKMPSFVYEEKSTAVTGPN